VVSLLSLVIDVLENIEDQIIPVVHTLCSCVMIPTLFRSVLLDPVLKGEELEDRCIRNLFVKVCIVKEVTCISACDSAAVSAILLDALVHRKEVAS
jgi:hypothetical protein